MRTNRVLRGDFGWVGLHVCLLHKINPQANEKLFAVGKMAQMPLLTYFFLGWVGLGFGEFVGFILIFICLPTQQDLGNRKDPTIRRQFGL